MEQFFLQLGMQVFPKLATRKGLFNRELLHGTHVRNCFVIHAWWKLTVPQLIDSEKSVFDIGLCLLDHLVLCG